MVLYLFAVVPEIMAVTAWWQPDISSFLYVYLCIQLRSFKEFVYDIYLNASTATGCKVFGRPRPSLRLKHIEYYMFILNAAMFKPLSRTNSTHHSVKAINNE